MRTPPPPQVALAKTPVSVLAWVVEFIARTAIDATVSRVVGVDKVASRLGLEPVDVENLVRDPSWPRSADGLQVVLGSNRGRPVLTLACPDGVTSDAMTQTVAARSVVEHWKKATGQPRAMIDAKRLAMASARLRQGFTPDQLRAAIDALAASSFHRGDNAQSTAYLGLEYALRDAATVERWLAKPVEPAALESLFDRARKGQ